MATNIADVYRALTLLQNMGAHLDDNTANTFLKISTSDPSGFKNLVGSMDYGYQTYGKKYLSYDPAKISKQYDYYAKRTSAGLQPIIIKDPNWIPEEDDQANQVMYDWYKTKKHLPQIYEQPEFEDFYKKNYWKGQYSTADEDVAFQEQGLPPMRIQTNQKVAQQYSDFIKEFDELFTAGKMDQQELDKLWGKYDYLSDLTKRARELSENAEYEAVNKQSRVSDWSKFEGTKKTSDSNIDTDYLKTLGYEDEFGFQNLYDAAMGEIRLHSPTSLVNKAHAEELRTERGAGAYAGTAQQGQRPATVQDQIRADLEAQGKGGSPGTAWVNANIKSGGVPENVKAYAADLEKKTAEGNANSAKFYRAYRDAAVEAYKNYLKDPMNAGTDTPENYKAMLDSIPDGTELVDIVDSNLRYYGQMSNDDVGTLKANLVQQAGEFRPFVSGKDDKDVMTTRSRDKINAAGEAAKIAFGLENEAGNQQYQQSLTAARSQDDLEYMAKYGHMPPSSGDSASRLAVDPNLNNPLFVTGNQVVNAATAGLTGLAQQGGYPQNLQQGISRATAARPIAAAAGFMAGTLLPTGIAAKGVGLVGKALTKAFPALARTPQIVSTFLEGGLSFGVPQFITDLNGGVSAKDASMRLLENMAYGGLGDVAFRGVAQILSGYGIKSFVLPKPGAKLAPEVSAAMSRAAEDMAKTINPEDFTVRAPGATGATAAAPAQTMKLGKRALASDTMGVSLRAPEAPVGATVAQGGVVPAATPRAVSRLRANKQAAPEARLADAEEAGTPAMLRREAEYPAPAAQSRLRANRRTADNWIPDEAENAGVPEMLRRQNLAAEAEQGATALAETESAPLFNGQLMGGANPSARPAQAFETSASRLSYRDKAKIKMQQILDPSASLKHLPGTKWAAGETNAVYRGAINSKNVQNQIANIYEVALVDKNGNVIGDSLSKALRENVPQGQEIDFWTAALQKHNIARAGEGKPIFSQMVDGKEVFFSAEESRAAFEAAIKLHPEWAQKINNITGWIKKFEKAWGVDTGLFEAKLFDDLKGMYPDYLPTNRAFNDLEDFLPGGGTGKGFVDQSNTLRTATGSSRNIIDPTENIINLVNRTVRTARLNEVGQLFADAVRKNPEAMRPIAEIVKADVANVDNVLRVLAEGKPVYIKVNDAATLDALGRMSSLEKLSDFSKVFSRVTGFMKQAITTKNPVFGLLNGFRDIQTYLTMSQANPVTALGRYARAGGEIVASDIINPVLRKVGAKEIPTPKLSRFRALGGEGATLTGAASSVKKASQLTGRVAITNKAGEITGYRNVNTVARLGKWIGKEAQKFNTAIEAAPRYAEYLNALKKGKSLEEALYDAAEITTNFSRGGRVLKEADAYMIYLNASAQGLSRLGRALNPANPRQLIGTLLKGGIAITLPTAILFEMNKDNPNYQALSNNIKDAYYLIPNIFDRDENGDPKTFIRIPKSRELGTLFGAFYERARRASMGEEGAYKDLEQSALSNLSPNIGLAPSAINPLVDLTRNKNFYGGNIVPASMQNRSPHLQYDEKTSEPAKWFANALFDVAGIEVSPKQLDYLADSYLGIISDVGLPMTTKSTYEKGIGAVVSPITRRFTADPLYSNQIITDFYDELDRLNTLAADRNFDEDIESGASTPEERQHSVLSNAAKDISDLSKQLSTAADPNAIREQMIAIAYAALKELRAGRGSQAVYPPGVDDQKRDEYDAIIAAGVPEHKMRKVFSRFAGLKPRGKNTTVNESDRRYALYQMYKAGELSKKEWTIIVQTYYPEK